MFKWLKKIFKKRNNKVFENGSRYVIDTSEIEYFSMVVRLDNGKEVVIKQYMEDDEYSILQQLWAHNKFNIEFDF